MPYSSTKQGSNIGGSTNQTPKISRHHHRVPAAASHQLSQIDFCFSPFRPMVPGHSQALQLFLPFLTARCAPVRAPGKRTVMVLLSFRWASGHPNGWSAW